MSETVYAIGAAVSIVATVLGVWSAWRRRQIMKRLLKSLDAEQRRALADALEAERGGKSDRTSG